MISNSRNFSLIFFLFLAVSGFSQNASKKSTNDSLVAHFNNYLKVVKLNELIKATGFSFHNEITQQSENGDIRLKNLKVLSLEPADSFSDPLIFAGAWNKTVQKLRTNINIYKLLLLKLSDYSPSPIDSLAIQLKADSSNVFSFIIYFDKGIKVIEPLIGVKGNATNVNIGPSDFDNSAFGGTVSDIADKPDLEQKIISILTNLLKPAVPKPKPVGSGLLFLTAYYNRGPVTGYRELVTINIIMQPSKIHGYTNLYFTFHVKYAGGLMNNNINPDNYRDVGDNDYYQKRSEFGANISRELKAKMQ